MPFIPAKGRVVQQRGMCVFCLKAQSHQLNVAVFGRDCVKNLDHPRTQGLGLVGARVAEKPLVFHLGGQTAGAGGKSVRPSLARPRRSGDGRNQKGQAWKSFHFAHEVSMSHMC